MEAAGSTATSRGRRLWHELSRSRITYANAWVPGRVIGGTAMILGSLLWLVGLVLRYFGHRLSIFTPEQSAWFAQ